MAPARPVAAHMAAALLVFLSMAGCVGNGADPESADTDAASGPSGFAEGLGVVEGRVTDEELRPIAGAQISLLDLEGNFTAETTSDGGFTIDGVPPGRHVVAVQKLGYESISRAIQVVAGETTTTEIALAVLPVQDPYVEFLAYDGFDVCSYALFGFVGSFPNPCPLGTPKNSFNLNLTDSWRYFAVETVWETQESFWVSIAVQGAGCTTGNPCPGVEISQSPNRIDGAPQDPELAARYSLDGERMYEEGSQKLGVSVLYAGLLREEINNTAPTVCTTFWGQFGVAERLGCPLGFGYSTGIRFQHYHSIFHWERPEDPASYTGMSDS